MPYELFIAFRYLTARRKNVFIWVFSLISLLGVTVGVMALVVALALMTGFQEDIQDKIFGANPHLTIRGGWGGSPIPNPEEVSRIAEEVPGVIATAPVVHAQGLLVSERNSTGYAVSVKGISPRLESLVTRIKEDIVAGNLDALVEETASGREGIILGKDLARNLGVWIGQRVNLLTARPEVSPFGLHPRVVSFEVVGIADSGFYDYDSGRCYISLAAARRLAALGAGATVVEVRVDSLRHLKETGDRLQDRIGESLFVTNILEMNRIFFSALKAEKLGMFLAIGLIVVVAGLNIISTLILMVLEKVKDIGTLMSLGATARSVMAIFILQGVLIGILGTLLGAVGGTTLCWFLDSYQVINLRPEVYYISYVPFKIRLGDVSVVMLVSIIVSFLATIYPSWFAARMRPVEALRYE